MTQKLLLLHPFRLRDAETKKRVNIQNVEENFWTINHISQGNLFDLKFLHFCASNVPVVVTPHIDAPCVSTLVHWPATHGHGVQPPARPVLVGLESCTQTIFLKKNISLSVSSCLAVFLFVFVIFRDLQSGNLFTNITIGPYARRGLFFNEYETRNIIRHYVSMVNPRLPFLESPVKHLLVDKEALQRTEGGDNPKNVDDWLARRISDILTDTYYKFSGILQSIQR